MGLFFAFAGYPLLVEVWRRAAARPWKEKSDDAIPKVTAVLIVANEAARLEARVENLFAARIPSCELDVVVVTDGSDDETIAVGRRLVEANDHFTLVELKERRGKANGLNEGITRAGGDIIVFADARQSFDPDTIPLLVAAFSDAQVGAVSGRLVIKRGSSAAGQGISSYWSLESRLREGEAQIDSCIGCTGAVYAIRRSLYRPIPPDTLLDDVVIPMLIAAQGYRVVYEPKALAYDPQDLDPAKEKIRKRRTLAGNFQMLCRYPGWLLPWRNRLWLQLIAHKYLRLMGPLFLLLVFVSSAGLRDKLFYGICLWLQVVFYAFAIFGLMLPSLRSKIFSLPAGFLFLNWMTIRGLMHFVMGPKTGAWEMVNRK